MNWPVFNRCDPVATAALGQVHGAIGLLGQFVEVYRADDGGHSQADGDGNALKIHQQWSLPYGLANTFSQHPGRVQLGLRENQQEFLAAGAGDHVAGAAQAVDNVRHLSQDMVSHFRAEAVIDLLEVIDIHHDGRGGQGPPGRLRQAVIFSVSSSPRRLSSRVRGVQGCQVGQVLLVFDDDTGQKPITTSA